MRILTFLAVTVLAATPASAEAPAVGTLVAAISGDWNNDDHLDAVTLTTAEDGMADLTVYRGGGIHGLDPILTLPGVVFAGPMAGQAPSFAPHGPTSFAILTEQTGVGRTPWFQRITLAWRDGAFVVAGFTYDFYDRLDLGHYGTCDVNLMTGDYTLTISRGDEQPDGTMIEGSAREEHHQGRTDSAAFPLADYTGDLWPSICDELFRVSR